MRIISYNLRKHAAAHELETLVAEHTPDLLCLQEADVEALPENIVGMVLAHGTAGNRLGIAVFYRPDMYRATDVRTIGLKKSLHDRIARPAHERVVAVRLHDIDDGYEFIAASFHAAPLTALNSLRRQQIRAALAELDQMGHGLPVIMAGDYNYPVFKENLGATIREHGYMLTLSDEHTYTRYRVFRGHYDFATSVGFRVDTVHTLPQGVSDHRPILITATRATASRAH
ncbi:endonuclease/exonuclease/phosphatase family protein [Microbacterium bovistercoris]|uniref:Endonuclease/exonuclease/phosphatase family protein n=1 Tax=Microbacterium bovistercoris TaxID=2293570 RepID=A0A371NXP6_9MICO|nr:endonuclease/exonuclease/phosphatase family protein [Microbacterium bovistercoris]REJ08074.1 endonuclease/exonuclease/phosphatase family protein [Microbacterium bovistercoris]